MFRNFDFKGSKDVDFKEFCNVFLPLYTGQYEDEEIRYAFRKFDKNNNGYITVSELKKVLSKLGHKFSTKEIKNFVASVDTNKDGKLSYDGNNFSFAFRIYVLINFIIL